MTLGAGQYLFRHDGLYKVTISIEDQEGLKGSSQEFFIKVGYNSVDCGSDYTKIAENPYKDDELKIYRYSNPSYKSNLVTFDSSTKTITVDNGALSWAPPILVASKGRFIPV